MSALNTMDVAQLKQLANGLIDDIDLFVSDVQKQGLEIYARELAYNLDTDKIKLAGRLESYRISLLAPKTFSEAMLKLEYKLEPRFHKYIQENKDKLNELIVKERDNTYSYFAMKTLQKGYLAKDINGITVETPQYQILRECIQCWSHDFDKLKKAYFIFFNCIINV